MLTGIPLINKTGSGGAKQGVRKETGQKQEGELKICSQGYGLMMERRLFGRDDQFRMASVGSEIETFQIVFSQI